MPQPWQDPRKRNAAMQVVLFLVFVALVGLAAWIGRLRWRAAQVTTSVPADLNGVRVVLPKGWATTPRGVTRLIVSESSGKDPMRTGRTLNVQVFQSVLDPEAQLTQWIRRNFPSGPDESGIETVVTLQALAPESQLSYPSVMARLIDYKRLPGVAAQEVGRSYVACVRFHDRAVIFFLQDPARRPQTDESLLRDLVRGVSQTPSGLQASAATVDELARLAAN